VIVIDHGRRHGWSNQHRRGHGNVHHGGRSRSTVGVGVR
jgi:hypothetical protein